MKMIVGLTGFCLISFAVGTYFAGLKTGACAMMFVFGGGLVIDSMKK